MCDVRLGKVLKQYQRDTSSVWCLLCITIEQTIWIMNGCTEQNLNVVTHFTVLMYHRPTGKCQHDLPVVVSVLF